MDTSHSNPHAKTKLKLTIDWRLVSAGLILLLALAIMLWQPWRRPVTKTISVQGQATIEQAPDLYRFQPVFQDADATKLTEAGNAAVVRIKQLGVKDKDIKTSVVKSSDNVKTTLSEPTLVYPVSQSSYTITFTVTSRELAQAITDYLATTSATGLVTPQADISQTTRTKVELAARQQASTDAKTKAKALADQLGVKLGRVTKVTESGTSGIIPLSSNAADVARSSAASSPVVQPGTDQINYTFTVEFEIK